ncbi:PDZ domain-containing protein [Arthrobacter sp. JSM 101049]|uniref:S41 family peptidase n=1 Tax=Arthrobacter sp. JSM 101049 TaxID=929097 RepID=UPI0035680A07
MSPTSYLRYPHVTDQLITFVAEDDVWLAPLDGGRAWRLSAQGLPARNPRFSADGRSVIWTIASGGVQEVVAASVDGGGYRQLTHWGHPSTRNRGFTPEGDIVAVTSRGQGDSRLTWAHAVPLDGSPAHRLDYGPVDSLAWGPVVGDERPLVVGSALSREPAWWKRYRGGTAGKLWIDNDGGGNFERLVPELEGNLCDPVWIGRRIAFLSDHEGYGNVYSVDASGGDLKRHTDHDRYYARHLASDGQRLVYESAGELWMLDGLDSEARRLDITLGSAGHARQPVALDVSRHLAGAIPDHDGNASIIESHGTLHLLVHRRGPARALETAPGVRARLGIPLGRDRYAFAADDDGREAIHIKDLDPQAPGHPAAAPGTSRDGAAGPDRTMATPARGEAAADDGLELPQPVSAAGLATSDPSGGIPHETPIMSTDADNSREEPSSDPVEGTSGETPAPEARSFRLPAGHRVRTLAASADGAWLAVAAETGHTFLLETATGSWHHVSEGGHGAVQRVAFSPDGRWLAFAEPVTAFGDRSRILLVSTQDPAEAPIEATDGRFRDHAPSFTPDGKYLAFLSDRSFDPLYDTHGFDLSFPASTKPFLIALDDRTPSLYGPGVYGQGTTGEAASGETTSTVPTIDPAGGQPTGTSGGDAPAPQTTVVSEGLPSRLFAAPVPQGRYESLVAVAGGLLWLSDVSTGVTGDGRAPDAAAEAKHLERFDHETQQTSILLEAAESFAVSGDGKRLVAVNDGTVRAVPTDRPAEKDSPDAQDVDLGRIRVRLDPPAVWAQAFDEAWRLQRDFYWVEDMAGQDWDAIAETYRPLVDGLGGHDDLVDLLWELHGELGTSHAYVTPMPSTDGERQGLLGADLEFVDGQWRIADVLAGESSDPQAYSPLAAPGVGVRAGDTLLAVDGIPVPDSGPARLLQGAAGKTVELTVRDGEQSPAPGSVRRVGAVPVRDDQRLRYHQWVERNRREVREASEGTFGYLHIPDMMPLGWAQLFRDLDQEASRDALLIDVRRNRGGHTSQLVAEVISRKVTAWSVAREMEPWTYPASATRGPVVILTDEWAGSDGDIITQVSKLRGIGPVVGVRTWGGVIGIDGQFDLVDGTQVTQPRYATWFTGGVGWGVENRGVDPDIEVPYPPHAYLAGQDPQLEQAVAVLKEMLREIPTQLPPERAGYPSRRPGPLPERPQAATGH